MSFGGSVLAMIITLKNNARHRAKVFEYLDAKKRSIRTYQELKYKKVSVERLARIKKNIRKESDKEDRRSLIRTMAIFGILSILLVGGTTYYYLGVQEKNKAIYARQELQRKNARKDDIAFYQKNEAYFLKNGKHYMSTGRYYNAKIQYSKAYQLDNENHEALRGLRGIQ